MRADPGRSAGPISLATIVRRLGGRVAGNPEVLVARVGSLENATADSIAFFSNPRYKSKLAKTGAAAVVLAPSAEGLTELPRIVADNPYAYFAHLSRLFNPDADPVPGVHPSAVVAEGAAVAPSAQIGPGAVVCAGATIGARTLIGAGSYVGEGAAIGEACRIHPSVVIHSGCRIGARGIVHSGAVIGADGFGIAAEEGRWVKIPQVGRVILGDDVEVGANTTIDRGAIDDTVLEDGVKLDNQIQIGHNCHIGANTAMAGCVAVAGSARIGRNCTIGAAAVILGHLSIPDNTAISAATVISRTLHKAGTYTGMYPFDENAAWARNTAQVRRLSELADRIKALEKRLADKENKDG
ncbi:MAG: UDP-3-O-(3-hydroxymyristoyl)glucosamine N-acyltransferase [Proteobacteria bacterium]|nr:UDP-3-O-(3-hydroxymyristoyl)glucosamine N-acyltransferase [Pseudomonadota bacterium]